VGDREVRFILGDIVSEFVITKKDSAIVNFEVAMLVTNYRQFSDATVLPAAFLINFCNKKLPVFSGK